MIYCKQVLTGIFCILLICGLAFSEPQDGPIEAYERHSPLSQELQAAVYRSAIEPVVAALKRKAKDDPQMLHFLDLIVFTATPHLMRPANAYATRPLRNERGGSVEVDLGWFQQANSIAMLAATRVIDPSNKRGIAYQVGYKYGAEVKEALISGRSPPNFHFSAMEYVKDPLELAYIRGLGTRFTDEAMAWTILHEIAHHKLGHLKRRRYDASKAASRRLELEADNWAYRKMQEMGISHFGVLMLMQMMDAIDKIFANAGIAVEESQSTHPSWSRRIAHLKAKYDPMKATTGGNFRTFMTKVNLAGPGQPPKIKRISYTFPRDPQSFGCLAFVQLGGMPMEFAVTDMRDGKMHLLQAPPGQLTDMTIANPDRTITTVVSTVTNRATGEVRQGTLLAWEQPWTLYGEVTMGGVRVGEAMQASVHSFFVDALRKTISDSVILNRAIDVLDHKLQVSCDISQRFTRGEMSRQELLRRSQQIEQQYMNSLKRVLGERNFARFQSNMMASPFAQAGIRQFMKLINAPK